MANALEVALFGLAGISAIGWLVWVAWRRQAVFLVVLLGVTVLESTRDFALTPTSAPNAIDEAFYIGHSGAFLAIGSIQLHIQDVISLVAVLASLIGLNRFRGGRLAGVALFVLGSLVVAGVATYSIRLGADHGINAWRRWILALSLVLFGATARRPWRWQDLHWVTYAAVFTVVLGLIEIRIHGLGSAYGWVYGSGVRVNGRPISEAGAAVVLIGAWAAALAPGRVTLGRIALVIGLIAAIIVFQQRTIWVATGVSVGLWLAVMLARSGRKTIERLSWGFVTACWASAGLLVVLSVFSQINDSLNQVQTYQWRVQRWQSSFQVVRDQLQWLLGGAIGPTEASVNRQFNGVYAHSLYVWSIETVGLIGLGALLVLVGSLCFTRVARSGRAWPMVVGAAALSIGLTYGLPDWLWLPIGMCAGWTGLERAAVKLPARRATGAADPGVVAT